MAVKSLGNSRLTPAVRTEYTATNCVTSRVTITARAGALTIYREVKGSEGFGATSPYRQHFGLGRATAIDSLEVWWPSGKRQKYEGAAIDRIVEIGEDRDGVRPVER